jgi:hypothetical protein
MVVLHLGVRVMVVQMHKLCVWGGGGRGWMAEGARGITRSTVAGTLLLRGADLAWTTYHQPKPHMLNTSAADNGIDKLLWLSLLAV